jgi:hypothetical protein
MTDTMMAAPASTHAVDVVSDSDICRAECRCGWLGEWQFGAAGADEDGVCHQDDSARAAEAMDLVMSGLLCLQDDLAAVVVWLAENWTTGLPQLCWSACGDDRDRDRPALQVLGYATPAEMTAAVVVLDTTMTDDPPDDEGNPRYRHAIRDFGRVLIDVFTDIPARDQENAR